MRRGFVLGLAALALCVGLSQAAAPPARAPKEPPLPAGALFRLGSLRLRHYGSVYGLEASPDGKTIASLGGGEVVRLWDLETGSLIWQGRYDHNPTGIAFIAGGKQIAVVYANGVVILDAASGKSLRRDRAAPAVDLGCASRDGKTLALTDVKYISGDGHDRSKVIRLWDVAAGRETASLEGHAKKVTGLAFFPDGKRIASSSEDGEVRVWDVAKRNTVQTLNPSWPKEEPRNKFDRWPQAVAVSQEGSYLAAGYWEGSVCVWSTRSWKQIAFEKLDGSGICGLAFSSAGLLAWGGGDGVGVFDVERRKAIWKGGSYSREVCFTPDGRSLIAGGGDGLIRIHDAKTGKERPSQPGHLGEVHTVAFSPGGDTIASLGKDGSVRLWDVATRQPLHAWKRSEAFGPSLAFSGAAKAVVFARGKKGLVFANPRDGKELVLDLPGEATGIACSPDGRTIAVRIGRHRKEGSQLRVYDARTKERLCELQDPSAATGFSVPYHYDGGLAISHDGRLLATSYLDRSVFLLDLRTKKPVATLGKHDGPVKGLAFSPDDRLLVTCNSGDFREKMAEAPIRVWHLGRMKQAGEFPSRTPTVSVDYSAAGDLLATVSDNGTIQVWETASGAELLRFEDEWLNQALRARFSPDGSVLASAMEGGTVLVWGLAPPGWSSPQEPLSDRELGRLWDDLSGEAPKAYRAMFTLAADKRGSVAFLKKRLRRVEAVPEKDLLRLISALDDEDFDKRQAASAALAKLGRLAEVAVRKEHEKPRSEEVRKRLIPLLKPLDGCFETDPTILREVRAVGVLRRARTPEARTILKDLALGAPDAAQTRAAKAALAALERAEAR